MAWRQPHLGAVDELTQFIYEHVQAAGARGASPVLARLWAERLAVHISPEQEERLRVHFRAQSKRGGASHSLVLVPVTLRSAPGAGCGGA